MLLKASGFFSIKTIFLPVTELAIQLHSKKDLHRIYDTQPKTQGTQPTQPAP